MCLGGCQWLIPPSGHRLPIRIYVTLHGAAMTCYNTCINTEATMLRLLATTAAFTPASDDGRYLATVVDEGTVYDLYKATENTYLTRYGSEDHEYTAIDDRFLDAFKAQRKMRRYLLARDLAKYL